MSIIHAYFADGRSNMKNTDTYTNIHTFIQWCPVSLRAKCTQEKVKYWTKVMMTHRTKQRHNTKQFTSQTQIFPIFKRQDIIASTKLVLFMMIVAST